MKTTILIDGQNLFHTLKDFKLKEQSLAWDKIFSSLLSSEKDELLGVYWFRPKEISEFYLTKKNIAKRLFHNKYKNREEELHNLFHQRNLPSRIFEEINRIYDRNLRWLRDEKKYFSQIRNKYIKLTKNYNEIQLVETGFLKVDPYTGTRIGEKGVDVAVAVKLVELSLTDRCDKIILFSGDLDFFEAIRVAKENQKRIEVVKFESQSGKGQSLSKIIEKFADNIVLIKEQDLKNRFFIKKNQFVNVKPNSQNKIINFRKRVMRMVVEDKIEEALDRMESRIENRIEELQKDIIHVKASFHSFKSAFRKGILLSSEANVQKAKIRDATLDILEEIVKKLKKNNP